MEPEKIQFLRDALRGNDSAVEFCVLLGHIARTWDNLYDDGCQPGSEDVNSAFWNALIALPLNAFYREHIDRLLPVMQTVASDWLDSNELVKHSEHEKHLAFVLRDTISSIAVLCATIVGGYEWGRRVGPSIRRFFYGEPLSVFMEEHTSGDVLGPEAGTN